MAEQARLELTHHHPAMNGLAIRCSTCYAYCSVSREAFLFRFSRTPWSAVPTNRPNPYRQAMRPAPFPCRLPAAGTDGRCRTCTLCLIRTAHLPLCYIGVFNNFSDPCFKMPPACFPLPPTFHSIGNNGVISRESRCIILPIPGNPVSPLRYVDIYIYIYNIIYI